SSSLSTFMNYTILYSASPSALTPHTLVAQRHFYGRETSLRKKIPWSISTSPRPEESRLNSRKMERVELQNIWTGSASSLIESWRCPCYWTREAPGKRGDW